MGNARRVVAVVAILAILIGVSTGDDVGSILTHHLFHVMLLHRNDNTCPAHGFYTYDAFITASQSFPGFGTTGDLPTRKREIAAFFAQTSHETTGGSPDGPHTWGYCFVGEKGNPLPVYCDSTSYPCPPGKKYFGRGPIQLTHNYNYVQAGAAIRADLINNPALVSTDAVVSYKTALWFWMTPQGNKPSSHDVIIRRWSPSPADVAANRSPGFGVITNIINGGIECGKGPNTAADDRVGFFKRYSGIFGVGYGSNWNCNNQRPFA